MPQRRRRSRSQSQQSFALRAASSARPAIASARIASERSGSSASLARISNRPRRGLWHKLRTASIRTISLLWLSSRLRRSSVSAGWSGRSILSACCNTGAGVRASFSSAATYSSPAISSSQAALLAVESLDRRQRRLEKVSCPGRRSQRRLQAPAEFRQPVLAHPLDRRESNPRIRVRQKARQDRLSQPADPIHAGSTASRASLRPKRPFEPASPRCSVGLERIPQTQSRRLLNERIVRFERLEQKISCAPDLDSRRIAAARTSGDGSEPAMSCNLTRSVRQNTHRQRSHVGRFVTARTDATSRSSHLSRSRGRRECNRD